MPTHRSLLEKRLRQLLIAIQSGDRDSAEDAAGALYRWIGSNDFIASPDDVMAACVEIVWPSPDP